MSEPTQAAAGITQPASTGGAVTMTPPKADPDAIPSHGLPKHARLTDAQINKISRAELAAIATDRGYRINVAGTRVTREAFRAEQAKDKNLDG